MNRKRRNLDDIPSSSKATLIKEQDDSDESVAAPSKRSRRLSTISSLTPTQRNDRTGTPPILQEQRLENVSEGEIEKGVEESRSQSQLRLSMSQLSNGQRCGKITRLHLVNFMCHDNLGIDFHSRINFLVGSNGSGKSAVLAALQLGLGARAKDTSRSTNMQRFIKTGQNSAKIEITLLNEGPQAYEPDKYGDRITIVRSINQTTSGYSIKSASGRVISRKLDELHHLLMYHNVQVDNPVFVLNQDASREMLKELEPKANYKIFLKATQIETISEKLTDCLHMNIDHNERLKTLDEKQNRDQTELAHIKGKLAQLMSLEELKTIISEMEVEHLWLKVTQYEEELQRINDSLSVLQEKRQKLQRKVTNKDEMAVQLSQTISRIASQIGDETNKYSMENGIYMQKKAQLKRTEDEYVRISSEMDSCKRRIGRIEVQITELRKSIEERSDSSGIAATRAANEAELNNLQEQRKENLSIIASGRQDLKMYVDDRMHVDEQLEQMSRQREERIFKIRSLDQQISSIQNASKDQLSIYGPHVIPFLIELTKAFKAGRLSEMPRGPVGRYVEVPNAQYRNIIEFQLRPILQAFIICNTKDRLTVMRILQQQQFGGYHPKLITTQFIDRVYDVRNGCVQPVRGTRVLMSEIRCKDPVVFNCLIDHIQIETILLTDSKEIAEQITADSQNVPYNLKKVIVVDLGLEYFPDPHYRMYWLHFGEARIIQVNVRDRIIQLKEEKAKLVQEIRTLEEKRKALMPKSIESKKLVETHRIRLNELERRRTELEQRITELEQFEYPKHNEVDILKEDLADHEQQLNENQNKLETKTAELSEAKKERDRMQIELRERQEVMDGIQHKMQQCNNNQNDTKRELRALDSNYQQNKQLLNELEKKIDENKTELKNLESQLSHATQTATKKGERINSLFNEEQLLTRIQENKAKLKQRSQIGEDPEKLRKLINVKEMEILAGKSSYENLKKAHAHLRKSLRTRFNFLKEFRNHMSYIISHTFTACCQLRNYLGTIAFNHETKTLTISVKPRDQNLENAVSSTRSLSGGERSFATVAFLLSLWACVDHPFYFLDEYDVFTDEVNREFITRLLIDEGKSHIDRQYAFLTPQALNLKHDECIQIHKFSEPSRK